MNKGYALIELLFVIIVISLTSWAILAIIDNFFININYPKYLIIGAILFVFIAYVAFMEGKQQNEKDK